MSSLALVPYTFSLLKLPLVALQNVADCLNPYEIYHFSRISQKTTKIVKVFSKKATHIFLISPTSVAIRFELKEYWSFKPTIELGPDSYTVEPDIFKLAQRAYEFYSKKPATEVLKVLERVKDLFKNSVVHLNFNTLSSSHQDLISYFNWCMENPSEVPYVSLKCSQGTDIQFFLENYKKPTEKIGVILWGEKKSQWRLNRERLELPDHLKTTLFKKVQIRNYKPVNLNLYNIFSSPVIYSVEYQLTNQDLNTFIKNWQSGLTNPHWRSVSISMERQTNLRNVLDGITATYRDPRTVKRQVSVDNESFWIFGGIDIEKHDGTATATIQWKKYKVENEDSEVPNEFIEEYERNQETGQIQHIEQELPAIGERLFAFSTFSMYIW